MKYVYIKSINPLKLSDELATAGFINATISVDGFDRVTVNLPITLTTAEQASLDTIIRNHSPLDVRAIVKARILAAAAFGQDLIAEYATDNVLAGYTIPQIKVIIDKTAKVQAALRTGSLYVAIDELDAIEPDQDLVTVEKITQFRNKIQDYLGIPRT